jgi:RNA-dependent RNA polymerase
LDGDLYFVSWNAKLMPPRSVAPMSYSVSPPSAGNVETLEVQILTDAIQRLFSATSTPRRDVEVTMDDIRSFFVSFMKNDNLGAIANTHLAMADQSPMAAEDPNCIRLAELHSKAVDFPKSGIPADFPRDLRVKRYPDFMGKKGKPMYASTRVLGQLYRLVSNASRTRDPAAVYDDRFDFSGFEDYVTDAYRLREEYNFKLNSLMNQFGVRSEGELVTGYILKFYRRHAKAKRKFDVRQQVILAVKEVRAWACKVFQECVEEAYRGRQLDESKDAITFRIASAWYYVTYHPDVPNPLGLRSFPWTADTVLMRMASLPKSPD